MNTIETIKVEKKLSAPLRVTTKRELRYSKSDLPCVIPAGTELQIHFSALPGWVYFDFGGKVRALGIYHADVVALRADNTLSGFTKPPSLKTMEKWSNDGVAKSVTGHRVEPDGFGPDGSPSWMLALGII
jgi:hypothetical protein